MAPYRPNRKTRRNKKYKKIMSEETNNEEVQAPEISLGDFNAMIRIIDVASERGAFKGAELSSVGSVRDRIAAFTAFHAPKEDGENNEATTEGEEATEETSE